jgi:hypothetical protein
MEPDAGSLRAARGASPRDAPEPPLRVDVRFAPVFFAAVLDAVFFPRVAMARSLD